MLRRLTLVVSLALVVSPAGLYSKGNALSGALAVDLVNRTTRNLMVTRTAYNGEGGSDTGDAMGMGSNAMVAGEMEGKATNRVLAPGASVRMHTRNAASHHVVYLAGHPILQFITGDWDSGVFNQNDNYKCMFEEPPADPAFCRVQTGAAAALIEIARPRSYLRAAITRPSASHFVITVEEGLPGTEPKKSHPDLQTFANRVEADPYQPPPPPPGADQPAEAIPNPESWGLVQVRHSLRATLVLMLDWRRGRATFVQGADAVQDLSTPRKQAKGGSRLPDWPATDLVPLAQGAWANLLFDDLSNWTLYLDGRPLVGLNLDAGGRVAVFQERSGGTPAATVQVANGSKSLVARLAEPLKGDDLQVRRLEDDAVRLVLGEIRSTGPNRFAVELTEGPPSRLALLDEAQTSRSLGSRFRFLRDSVASLEKHSEASPPAAVPKEHADLVTQLGLLQADAAAQRARILGLPEALRTAPGIEVPPTAGALAELAHRLERIWALGEAGALRLRLTGLEGAAAAHRTEVLAAVPRGEAALAPLDRPNRDLLGALDELGLDRDSRARRWASLPAELRSGPGGNPPTQAALDAVRARLMEAREALDGERRRLREVAGAPVRNMGERFRDLTARIATLEARTLRRLPQEAAALAALREQCTGVELELAELTRDAAGQRGRWLGVAEADRGEEPPAEAALADLGRRLSTVRNLVDGEILGLEDRQATEVLDSVGFGAGNFGIAHETRWERAKRHLADAMRAYVDRHINGFMMHFDPHAEIDLSVVRNAVLADFVDEAQVRIDIELLSYAFAGDDLVASLRWNRISTQSRTGAVGSERGTSQLVFRREADFRITAWRQSTPFGRRDLQLRAQVMAGQVNDETGTFVAPVPVSRTLTLLVPDHALIDLEGRTVRLAPGLPFPAATPQEDVRVIRNGLSSFDVQDADGLDPAVGPCNPVPAKLLDLRQVDQGGLVAGATTGLMRSFHAVRTAEGRFGFLEIRVEPSPEQVTFTFVDAATVDVNPFGTQDCP